MQDVILNKSLILWKVKLIQKPVEDFFKKNYRMANLLKKNSYLCELRKYESIT